MTTKIRTWALRIAVVAALAAAAFFVWKFLQPQGLPTGIAAGNGRIEAVEIDIAAKTAGRIREIRVKEGDFVQAGQELARMDTAVLEAQLREAEAQMQRGRIGVETARSQVAQRAAEHRAAEALIAQRKAELDATQRRVARSEELASKDFIPVSKLDDDRAAFQAATAAASAVQAQAAAAQAALGRARSDVIAAEAAVDAVAATIQRIRADLDDSVLKAPRDGRVQYRVAQPGEVLSPGGVVLNMVDLTDVYMTFFLPTEQAGRVALGAEARLVLDAAPQYVIPAKISFVADVAQFTPKTVETAEERQKLTFRIKARIDPDLLARHLHQVKTGLPGMAYVRLDPQADWPPDMQVRLPQ
ncbi:MAG: HlyD family efflux transporter periplasmic adaptor subunit [Thiobacillus sp.]|uniref:HlyD family secretion protein n=1 Tax=Thiobacillus sp. TaxID=924 RepID=UPI00168C5D25|nr:HlyD family efflux transporter periplasmic adaptor subunit [Thiobacillus sp.]QLQ02628.1 MAG: HlyD family efflux transporter periplasmic adaptor subunit [Thiobacillus sp.]